MPNLPAAPVQPTLSVEQPAYSPQHNMVPVGGQRDDYSDHGCEVSPSCLSCPLPACRFEVFIHIQLTRFWKSTTRVIARQTDEPLADVALREFGIKNHDIYRKNDTSYPAEDYAFHPYLQVMWDQGYRPSKRQGRPSHVLSTEALPIEGAEGITE